ncbi:MAG: hypothetical protein MUF21_12745 [Gemmatimonadaceae bacterium]|nr:hypothetical protein [Gemmatimonadaceae bacterium]
MPAGRLRPGLLPRVARRLALLLPVATALPGQGAARAARIPTPAEATGLAIGADRVLADWPQVVRYFATLARSSPAVKLDTLGRSALGAPLVAAVISTPANVRRLPQLLATQRRLADPRGLDVAAAARLARTQPVVLWVNCNLHSTEIASSQFAMEFAHALVTVDSLQRALANVVVVLVPSANPDGMQLVVDWYRQGVGTPFEGGPMPWVYHKYVGHDNNRDWYMITQQETRVVTEALYRTYRPNIFWDVHQQGSYGMRLTVPPHVDPINPNVDSRLVRGINLIGHTMAWTLEQAGKTGVGDGVTYDLWWHGGARSTPTRHNMVGVLTEAASARIATPLTIAPTQLVGAGRGLPRYQRQVNFPSPWPGGTWRLRDIMDYELVAGTALVQLASTQREAFVTTTHAVARDMVARGTGQRYVIPRVQADAGAAAELVRVLRRGAVEVDSVAGAWIVRLDQPYAAHARDLLEVQRWPASAGDRPYDVAGWTLPYQMGVDVVYDSAGTFDPTTRAGARRLDDSDSWQWIVDELRASRPVRLRTFTAPPASATFAESAAAAPRDCSFGLPASNTTVPRDTSRTIERLPRIGLYRPWTANMDEGWTRWLLVRDRDRQHDPRGGAAARRGRAGDRRHVAARGEGGECGERGAGALRGRARRGRTGGDRRLRARRRPRDHLRQGERGGAGRARRRPGPSPRAGTASPGRRPRARRHHRRARLGRGGGTRFDPAHDRDARAPARGRPRRHGGGLLHQLERLRGGRRRAGAGGDALSPRPRAAADERLPRRRGGDRGEGRGGRLRRRAWPRDADRLPPAVPRAVVGDVQAPLRGAARPAVRAARCQAPRVRHRASRQRRQHGDAENDQRTERQACGERRACGAIQESS